jgi:hypothetical protein
MGAESCERFYPQYECCCLFSPIPRVFSAKKESDARFTCVSKATIQLLENSRINYSL